MEANASSSPLVAAFLVIGVVACSGGIEAAGSDGTGGGANTSTSTGGGGIGGGTGSGFGGAASGSASSSGSGGTPNPSDPCDFPAINTVEVTDKNTLSDALDTAEPGTKIHLAKCCLESIF